MKHLAFAAVALLIAAPSHAYPQWLPVSADKTVQIDYNSIRVNKEGIRSVDLVGGPLGSAVMHVSCSKWKAAFTAKGNTSPWQIIYPGKAPETAAYILCPGQWQQPMIQATQELIRGPDTTEEQQLR